MAKTHQAKQKITVESEETLKYPSDKPYEHPATTLLLQEKTHTTDIDKSDRYISQSPPFL